MPDNQHEPVRRCFPGTGPLAASEPLADFPSSIQGKSFLVTGELHSLSEERRVSTKNKAKKLIEAARGKWHPDFRKTDLPDYVVYAKQDRRKWGRDKEGPNKALKAMDGRVPLIAECELAKLIGESFPWKPHERCEGCEVQP